MSVYDQMSDKRLLKLARRCLAEAACLPPGSIERSMRMAAHDSVMNELKRRLARSLTEGLGLPDAGL